MGMVPLHKMMQFAINKLLKNLIIGQQLITMYTLKLL